MDPNLTVATTDVALLGAVWTFTQLAKRLLEETVLPAAAPTHDSIVQLIALVLGIGTVFLRSGLPDTGSAILSLIIEGTAVGIGALGVHSVASNAIPNLSTPTQNPITLPHGTPIVVAAPVISQPTTEPPRQP
jgi:hypothetical protein